MEEIICSSRIKNSTNTISISNSFSKKIQKIPTRKMGSQGLKCSIQGLGCMNMTAAYDTTGSNEEKNIELIGNALEMGINLLDTAFIYQNFTNGETNESLIGKAFKKYGREKFILSTKCGIEFTEKGAIFSGKESSIRSQCEESLRRLNTDYIDLYYLHRIDPSIPIEESMLVFKQLFEEGKIKYAGLSECTPEELEKAHKVFPITAIQMEWSLVSREIEKNILLKARKLNIAIVAYSPLCRGLLSKTFSKREEISSNDFRANLPRFDKENFENNIYLTEKLEEYAKKKGFTVAQIALAWVHNQGFDVFPIPGTKNLDRLYENSQSAFIKLSNEEMLEIEKILEGIKGERYNEEHMKSTFEARMKK